MSLNDWFPRLLADPNPSGNVLFGADASAQQYPVPGLLVSEPSDFGPGGKYDLSQTVADPSAQTTLMGQPLSQLQMPNYAPDFTPVRGLLDPTPLGNGSDVPPILNSSATFNPAPASVTLPSTYWTMLAANPAFRAEASMPDPGARAAYGETRGLYPQQAFPSRVFNMDSWDPESATDLNMARTWIAEVQKKNNEVHYVNQPSGSNPIENSQWRFAENAAKNAGNQSPANVRNFFIRQDGVGKQAPDWAKDSKPYKSFGPFINTGGGDVPRGNNTYIDFYKDIK